MTNPLTYFLPLILLLVMVLPRTEASHEASEPSDGTVNSFRWLESPIPAGDVLMHNIDDQQVKLSEFRGKVILLNLWASWCPPCIRELPALDRLQQRMTTKDFLVLTISLDKNPQLAREMFIDRLPIMNLDFYIQSAEQIGRFFPVDVLPANFIIDREGQVLGMLRSYVDWDDPQVDKLFMQLVAGDGKN